MRRGAVVLPRRVFETKLSWFVESDMKVHEKVRTEQLSTCMYMYVCVCTCTSYIHIFIYYIYTTCNMCTFEGMHTVQYMSCEIILLSYI